MIKKTFFINMYDIFIRKLSIVSHENTNIVTFLYMSRKFKIYFPTFLKINGEV